LTINAGLCDDFIKKQETKVKLLKYPYPYSAALTIASDTHQVNLAVENFEAIHVLINTEAKILRGSKNWNLLFDDHEISKNADWHNGVHGFGLPIADSMYLFQRKIGLYKSYDEEKGKPVSQYHNGQDLREIIDRWLRLGWVDTLHTPGPGHITRDATATGLKWLHQRPYGHLKVWTNHSLTKTPTCIEPDQPAFPLVIKNVIKCGTATLCWLGLEPIARKIASDPYPKPFPRNQKMVLWILGCLFFITSFALFTCLIFRKFRKRILLISNIVILLSVTTILSSSTLHYAQGDNPRSEYYHADLLRNFGIRYYWMISNLPDYKTHIADTLVLPERSYGGRPSCLRIVALDDGSKCFAFGRCYKGRLGVHSLELLTETELEKICKVGGTSIIYTHWNVWPKEVFTAKTLEGLTLLRRYYDIKRIWVAPTSKILNFTFIRAYLEYNLRIVNDRCIIDILRIRNPVGEPFVPSIDDLRGISFECPIDELVKVQIDGKPIEENKLEFLHLKDRLIVRFPI
jgi:hypothetical protein